MARQCIALVAFSLLSAGHAINVVGRLDEEINAHEVSAIDGSSVFSSKVEAMKKVMERSEEVHQQSMSNIMKAMTVPKAYQILKKGGRDSPELEHLVNLAQGKRSSLRKQAPDSSIDSAKEMLNGMIIESLLKYESEITACTNYYAEKCNLLDDNREKISAANGMFAQARTRQLFSQSEIERCERDLPEFRDLLWRLKEQCADELLQMNDRKAVLKGDIDVMTGILAMLNCPEPSSALMQVDEHQLLYCTDKCTKKGYFASKQKDLHQKLNKLQSSLSRDLMQSTFADMVHASATKFIEVDFQQQPSTNTTPVELPQGCDDENAGAPPPEGFGDQVSCTLGPDDCGLLQEKFLNIQAGIQDEFDELKELIQETEDYCEESQLTTTTQILLDEHRLSSNQESLSGAMVMEADYSMLSKTITDQQRVLDGDLKTEMATCTEHYLTYEGEVCALRTIRGEVFKMRSGDSPPIFKDCDVSKWEPEECSASCAGGSMILTREVEQPSDGGTKCLPLVALRRCNEQHCPIPCKVEPWEAWSKCTADCGGGTESRMKKVDQQAMFGGMSCGETTDSETCHTESCEADCELHDWEPWSECSKECEGGTMMRERNIKEPAVGDGLCPDPDSEYRLEYKECNTQECYPGLNKTLLDCNENMDVVLALDGSTSMGADGFAAVLLDANMIVHAFGPGTQCAVILYSGPAKWGDVRKCSGNSDTPVEDFEDTCKIKTVVHFGEHDQDKTHIDTVKEKIDAVVWPKGGTLTSLALMAAEAEFMTGNSSAPPIVIVFTDGKPLSVRKTKAAAREIRKKGRLVWVPITEEAPIDSIKKWATRRWEENVVPVPDFDDLLEPDSVNHILADVCQNLIQSSEGEYLSSDA